MSAQPSPTRLTDRKRDAIVQAAIEEFRQHGFNGTSMDRVAAAAEVSKRTVYNHFPSKEDLFEAILMLMWERSRSPEELVATPAFAAQWFGPRGITRTSARRAPAVVFNRKDSLHANALLNAFGLQGNAYVSHYVPASEAFVAAIRLGLGYGMVPELQIGDAIERGELVDVMPEAATEVALYWHGWAQQPPRLERLAQRVMQAARQLL